MGLNLGRTTKGAVEIVKRKNMETKKNVLKVEAMKGEFDEVLSLRRITKDDKAELGCDDEKKK